jgi:hypothetical protein
MTGRLRERDSRRDGRRRRPAPRLLAALAAVAVAASALTGLAWGERAQYGSLIVSLDGGISPLKLPRQDPAPIALHYEGGLETTDGSVLPRVVKVEFAVPGQGILSTRGLPRCSRRQLHGADSDTALANCRSAFLGQGRLQAQVVLPNQGPFRIEAHLLMFNGRPIRGHQVVLMHAYASQPPLWVVLPFVIHHRQGWLGTTMVARLPRSLGPWPHFAHFGMTLSRRYRAAGRSRSFIMASCPIPRRFTAGFFPLTRVTYTLLGGQRVSTSITRGCRAR